MRRPPVTAQTNGHKNGASPVVKGALLTVSQASQLLGVDERWLRRRMSSHLFPFRKLNGRIVILRSELDAFIDSLEDLPGVSLDEAKHNQAMRSGDSTVRR